MFTRRAFTFIELLVSFSIVLLLIGILLPAIGAMRRNARCMQNSTQPRGIHSGLVLYSQDRNGYYPGIDKDGNRMEDYSTEYRFQALLDDEYFTCDYLISPSENKIALTQTGIKPTTENFSYALLNLSDLNAPRMGEWKDTVNGKAIVISDRAISLDDQGHIKSVHTNPSNIHQTLWRGTVAWNDNHATFEATNILNTTYKKTTTPNDNIFDANAASMVYSGNDLILDKN